MVCSIMDSHVDTFPRVWLNSLIWLSWTDFCREALKLFRPSWVQQALGAGWSWLELLECFLCRLQCPSCSSPSVFAWCDPCGWLWVHLSGHEQVIEGFDATVALKQQGALKNLWKAVGKYRQHPVTDSQILQV